MQGYLHAQSPQHLMRFPLKLMCPKWEAQNGPQISILISFGITVLAWNPWQEEDFVQEHFPCFCEKLAEC